MPRNFGGYKIDFASVKDTKLSEVFGVGPMPPNIMVKKLWDFVKSHNLGG